jgi:GT2 family glycosyltransferase
MTETIAAVVATYNRSKLLFECLGSILEQSRPVDAIFIIDNHSTDNTQQLLFEAGFIKEMVEATTEPIELSNLVYSTFDKQKIINVYYVRLHENTGGAGAFHEGIKRAYEKGYDWIWVMDDDVKASDKHALESMLKYKEISKCIYPMKVDINGNIIEWEGYFNIETGFEEFNGNKRLKEGKEFVNINYGCFEGMLINRKIVEKISFPDKRFFIYGDDAIYGYLSSKYTNPIYIKRICLKKTINNNNKYIKKFGKLRYRPSNLEIYYGIRNRFLIFDYLKSNKEFNKKKAYMKLLKLCYYYARNAIIYDLSIKKFKLVFIAIYHGLIKKYGKNVKL